MSQISAHTAREEFLSTYLDVAKDVYAAAARQPQAELCCAHSPVWSLPDLHIPQRMLEMNYGCGSTVDPRELRANDTVLYVGVGGGLEALQFAYFTRRPRSVIAVDPVAEMRDAARENFDQAARTNPWFLPNFIQIIDGDALDLPVSDHAATVVAQNCLFNIFRADDFSRALAEVHRVLQRGGRFYTSDPITPVPLPDSLTADDRLRARCISGCQTFQGYIESLTKAGFGRLEIRARIPYRLLSPAEYPELHKNVLLESIEAVAFKEDAGPDGVAVFTGRTAIYAGLEPFFDDGRGQVLSRGVPVPVSDAAARRLQQSPDIVVTESSYRSRSSGCC